MKAVDDFIKAVINDRDIFYYNKDKGYDKDKGEELFNKEEMSKLKGFLEKKEDLQRFVSEKINDLKEKNKDEKNKEIRKNRERCIELANSIMRASKEMPILLKNIIELFNDLGLFKPNLPKGLLEDVGSLIETTDQRIVEQFVLSKKEKIAKSDEEKAIAINRFLGHLKVLYSLNLSLPEKGFLIRKLNTLVNLKEVFKV